MSLDCNKMTISTSNRDIQYFLYSSHIFLDQDSLFEIITVTNVNVFFHENSPHPKEHRRGAGGDGQAPWNKQSQSLACKAIAGGVQRATAKPSGINMKDVKLFTL